MPIADQPTMRAGAASPPRQGIQRVALADTIAQELTAMILRGEIEPGTFLREGDLAARFVVSRQSLRAAMMTLHHMGLLRRETNRGYWVPRLSRDDIDDVFDMRELVDEEAGRRVAGDRSRLDAAAEILTGLERLRPDAHGPEVIATHFAFHRAMIEAAGSPRLLRFYDLLYAETWLSLGRATLDQPTAQVSRLVDHHRVLLDGIAAATPEEAGRLARGHVADGRPTATSAADRRWERPPTRSEGSAEPSD
jgi:DNA-binding GntR family transcriptional regulator